jgi:hypothetical protein
LLSKIIRQKNSFFAIIEKRIIEGVGVQNKSVILSCSKEYTSEVFLCCISLQQKFLSQFMFINCYDFTYFNTKKKEIQEEFPFFY